MKNKLFSSKRLKLAMFFIFFYNLQNCSITQTQQKALQNFGETAVVMSSLSSNELIAMRDATILMNLSRIRLEALGKQKEEVNSKEAAEYKDLDGSFDISVISLRLKAIATLHYYAKLLLSLASDSSQKELEMATQNFLFSVENLSGEYKKMDEKKLNSIGEAIKLFGGIWTEYKKKDSIKSVILESKDQIELLCDLLSKDFDPKGNRLATSFIFAGEELLTSAEEKLDKSEPRPEKIKSRALLYFHLAEKNIQKKNTVLPEISKSILNLKSANAELYETFRSEIYTSKDIVKFVNTVKAVQDYKAILK
jgi:hypothetical protein